MQEYRRYELCGRKFKENHEQACEIRIKVHDTFANFLEGKLRKSHRAIKVTTRNENRSLK